jgi:hypothetical protein
MVLREVPIQILTDDQHSPSVHLTATHCSSRGVSQMVSMQREASPRMVNTQRQGSPNMVSLECGASVEASIGLNCDPEHVYAGLQTMIVSSYSASSDPSGNGVCDEISTTITPSMSVRGGSAVRAKREISEVVWPSGDENIVRYLISKQKFDGLWNLEANDIERLTGKPLTSFPQGHQDELLITAIVVVALETRFRSLPTLWHGVVQKARKQLINFVGNDVKKLDALFKKIR